MIGVLRSMLCWLQQIGAMVANGFVLVVNTLLDLLWSTALAAVLAWPIGFPDLPDMPDGLETAFRWIAWSPLPVEAIGAFIAFYVTAATAMFVGVPVLRWLKVLN